MSTAGLVLGILSIATGFFYVGIIFGILGVIFSLIARKRDKSGMTFAGIICSIIGICLSIIMIAGAPKSGNKTGSSKETAVSSSTESTLEPKSSDNLADQISTTLYDGKSSYGDGGYAALYIKNNSDMDVDVEATFTARDSSGNAIGSASDEEYCIAAGQEALLTGYFDSFNDDSSCDYTMKVNESTNYHSMYNDISFTENTTDENLVFTATNNGDKDAYFVEAKAIFLNGGKLVDADETYMINDDDSALNPGQTLSGEIYIPFDMQYDQVIYTYSARDQW